MGGTVVAAIVVLTTTVKTMAESSPLIVGAGPVGLAAALFLARQGLSPRIIDAAGRPEIHSRALAVNPRTLEILEPAGITAEMLEIGKPIHGVRFWSGSEKVGELTFESLNHPYRFMLALSQEVTVRLLEKHLNEHGIQVERNVALVHCRNGSKGVEAGLLLADEVQQRVECPWLLAADGAHSAARRSLGIEFQGSAFERKWWLVDVALETSLADDFAHVIFQEGGGFLFLIRVVHEPEKKSAGDPVWRVMGDFPDLLARLDGGHATAAPIWSSSFQISHRIGEQLQQGQIYFAGDSAHVHSPIGARGMNLGIEDALVFSSLLKSGELSRYGDLRRRIDRRVVRRIEMLSRLARGESATARVLRSKALPLLMSAEVTRKRLIAMVTGLDHPLKEEAAIKAV
jgi:2-polyprenyl-6-methoxyphenol hydroxylase-like FAD-dependent oxidoreductase